MVYIKFLLFNIFHALRIFEALQIFFSKFLVKYGKNEEGFESSIFFEAQKYYFVFESRLNFFFKRSYSQRCFDVVQRCKNRRWKFRRCLTLINSTLEYRTFWRFDLTLCGVATSYQPKNNVEPTLKHLLGQK